jgi:formylglycine-generating enzyme required for sulfatase activity
MLTSQRPFLMGSHRAKANRGIDAFYMDRTPVTNRGI